MPSCSNSELNACTVIESKLDTKLAPMTQPVTEEMQADVRQKVHCRILARFAGYLILCIKCT